MWELTEADQAGYVELHLDEPEASVSGVDGPPHRWVSELHPLEEIEADADNIHGELGDDAELLATYCPTDTLPHTGGPIALLALLGTALMGGGLALHRLRA